MAKWWKRALGSPGRDKATALVTQGFVFAREGKHDDARRCYEQAIDADATLAVAHLNLGLCKLDLFNKRGADDVAAALADIAGTLERALAVEPSYVGYRALANVLERRQSFAGAHDAWKKVEESAPKEAGGALHPAVVEARARQKALEKRAAADRARMRALLALHTDVSAEEKSAALSELAPFVDDSDAAGPLIIKGHALAGTLARRAGEREAARAYLERAAAADKNDIDVLKEIASVYLEEGDFPRALAASYDAYRERPTEAGLVCNVGVCHLGLGDLDKAKEFIDLAHELEPKDPIVLRAKDALARAVRR